MSDAAIPLGSSRRALPRPVGRVLLRIGLALRVATCLRGLGTLAVVLAILAALAMAADFVWSVPRSIRWATWGAWVGLGAVLLLALVIRPLIRRFQRFDLAAAAEQGHPELGEDLTGAVALTDAGSPHGSPELIAALADRAARSCRSLRPSGPASLGRASARFLLGLLAVASIAAPALLRPDSFGVLARRFFMPWASIDRLARVAITVTPGDAIIAAGSDLTVTVEARPLLGWGTMNRAPESAWLEWKDESATTPQRIAMEPAAASETSGSPSSATRFRLKLPRLARSIAYRVSSGDATSRDYRVTALEPPAVASLTAKIEPPDYTRRPGYVAPHPERLEAFEGSRVTFEVAPSRAVRSIELEWPAEEGKPPRKTPAAVAQGGRSGSVSADAGASGPYRLALTDEHGIASTNAEAGRITVQPDEPPTVSVRGADGIKEAAPSDTASLAFAARDDVAVASVEVHYVIHRNGSAEGAPETGHRSVAATTEPGRPEGAASVRGVASLPLGPLGLHPGDRIAYRLRVADNRPAPKGPNITWSPDHELTIVAGAEPIAARLAKLRSTAIKSMLDALRKDLSTARGEVDRQKSQAESAARGESRWDAARRRELEAREKTLADLVERLMELARSLGQDPATRSMARSARQIAELEAAAARSTLARARQEEDPARAAEGLRKATDRMTAVGERLDQLQNQLQTRNQEAERRGRLHELADRQEQLAGQAETPPRGRVELDQLRAGQVAVQKDLDALVRATPDLRGAILEAEAREADRLARSARELAARQNEESRRAADTAHKNARLRALADAQRALEDDARRLALDVDPALSENGRARVNVEAVRQAVEPIEHGDIDKARQQLEGAESELRKLARDIEEVPGDAKSLAWRLLRRQDALNADAWSAIARLREKDKLTKDEQTALTARLQALGRRQEAIAKLAATIKPPEGPLARSKFPEHAAREAVDKTRRAAEAFGQQSAQVIEERKNEARQALDRLANELPDWWRRTEPTRQKFDEARRATNELFNQVQQHLRETEPRDDRPATSAKAAEELSRRLGDAPDRLAGAIRSLKEMEPDRPVVPQRDRAVRAAEAMERVLRDLREPARRENARVALAAAEARAHATMDRLEQKMSGRTPADDVAAELAGDQGEVAAALAVAPGDAAQAARAEAAESERRLANALRALSVPDAPLEQAEAVRLAERAAHALADPASGPAGTQAAQAAARAASALADRLAGRQPAAERAKALARAERALEDPESRADPAGTSARQKAIAAELALLPASDNDKAEAQALVADAARLADRLEEIDDDHAGPSRPTPRAVSGARAHAAAALEQLAAHVAPEKPAPEKPAPPTSRHDDPALALKPEHLDAARELVHRERRLSQEFLEVLGEHVAPQEAIRGDAVKVGRELIELRDRIRPISDRGAYPAFAAGHHLRAYAAQAMDQAAEHLSRGNAPYARDAQRRASENLDKGAQLAEDLAAALRAERMALSDAQAQLPGSPQGAKPALGEARSAIAQAARQLDRAGAGGRPGESLPPAREAMREAARDLAAAAQAADSGLAAPSLDGFDDAETLAASSPTRPAGKADDTRTRQGQPVEADLAALQEAVRRGTGRTWGELPGHLRTEILQSARGRYRDEYARLIQLYFREIAAGAAADKPAK